MRLLTIFVDMVRPNRLSIYQKKKNHLDNFLINLGGTFYTNVISPGPDTPRATATYFSGKPPWENGCDTRAKWSRFFLNKDTYTNIQLFSDKGYEQYFFTDPNERNFGLLPHEANMHKNNNDLDLKKFINKLELNKKSHLFVSLPDFHWVLDDFGYNRFSEKLGYKKIISSMNIIFEKFHPDIFDHIIIFSDHGFKFFDEINFSKNNNGSLYTYNEDRINSLFFHRIKKQQNLKLDNKLLSLADVQTFYKLIIEKKNIENNLKPRKFVCYEDHLDFGFSNFMQTEIFGLVKKDFIYIRGFDKALKLDREGRFISNKLSKKLDSILSLETSFAKKLNYFKKLQAQQGYIDPANRYTNGSKRIIKKYLIIGNLRSLIVRLMKIIFKPLFLIFK